METVTMTTASLSQQRGGGSGTGGGEGGGEIRRRTRREGETKRRTGGGGGGGLGPPDLDLDLVEEEAREGDRREEERKKRSQTVRPKEKRDVQMEQWRSSRSLPRVSARSWDASLPEERVDVEEPGSGGRERRRRSETKSRRRTEAGREEVEGEERRDGPTRHAKHSGRSAAAQRAPFSFLGPMDDDEPQRLSDSESAASYSEVSLSAASIATAGWRQDFDWRRAESPLEQGNAPGPWLKPSPQRLTQALIGSRLRGGLSL